MCKKAKGTVCYACRQAGAAFARAWMRGLDEAGTPRSAIAEVVGTTPDVVRARLSDMRAAA